MKTLLSIKTLYRTPLKTLLALLLLAATSFALFFSASEYAAVSRERARAVDYYQGVGAVEVEAPQFTVPGIIQYPAYALDIYLYADDRVEYNPYGEDLSSYRHKALSSADIEAISALPYVTTVTARYMTAGIVSGESGPLLRYYDIMESDLYNFMGRLVIEATLERDVVQHSIQRGENQGIILYDPFKADIFAKPLEQGESRTVSLVFDRIGAPGDTSYPAPSAELSESDKRKYTLVATAMEFSPDNDDGSISAGGYKRAQTVFHYGKSFYNDVYSKDFVESLVPGERYILILRSDMNLILGDQSTFNWWPQVYPVKDLPEGFMELDEFEPLRKMIEITNNDRRTLDVVYTEDMSSIFRVADGSMVITEGRMLTREDADSKNNVCVMNYMYMRQNNLKIGDKIYLKLGDKLFEQNPAIGAVASVRERYADNFTDDIEFEIVGAYRDVDKADRQLSNLFWTYSVNTVFVPQSFLPCSVPDDHVLRPGEFSFIIDDPRNISAFLKEAQPVIDNLGLTLYFSDGGWGTLESQINESGKLAVIRLLLLSLSVFVAIGLTVYLFIGRKTKEYAVMRALGTPASTAGRSLYIPLSLLAVIALILGNALAGKFTGGTIERALAPFAEAAFTRNSATAAPESVPVFVTVICVVCELAALALVTAFGLRRIGKKPPLELLQNRRGGAGGRAGGAKFRGESNVTASPRVSGSPLAPDISHASDSSLASDSSQASDLTLTFEPSHASYSSHSTLSSRLSTLSSKNRSTAFTARHIARHIRRSAAKSLLSLGLALLLAGTIGQFTVIRSLYADMYDRIQIKAHLNKSVHISALTDFNRMKYITNPYYLNEIPLNCGDIYTRINAVMTNDISRYGDGLTSIEFLDGYDYTLFDKLVWQTFTRNTVCVLSGDIMDKFGVGLGDQIPIITAHLKPFDPYPPRVMYTIVGRTTGCEPDTAFFPLTKGFDMLVYANELVFDYVEFTLESPQYADQFRAFVKPRMVNTVGGSKLPFVMDTSEADNALRTINLLSALYPIAIAAAAIMGGLFPGLIVMQSDREAATMRALGTTKKRTRAFLIIEQALLCAAGLILAAGLLLVINGSLPAESALPLAAYAVLQLAACSAGALTCAVVVTRRRILELLQVRE